MCEELKDEDNMFAYVEKAASTSLCSFDGQGCSDKQKTYIEKWTGKKREDYASQMARIDKMLAGDQSKLSPDSLSWMKARRKLLESLAARRCTSSASTLPRRVRPAIPRAGPPVRS